MLPLSLPLPPEVRSIVSLPTDWREQHLPMALLLDYSSQYLLHDEIQVRRRRRNPLRTTRTLITSTAEPRHTGWTERADQCCRCWLVGCCWRKRGVWCCARGGQIRSRATRLLHGIVLRQLADERYACPEYVPRLAGLFLPFLPFLLPHAKVRARSPPH